MRIHEIRRSLELLGVTSPTFVETDDKFSTWQYGTDTWFRWDRPVSYRLPAVLWNREDGLMTVKEVRDEGPAHKGIVWPMTGKYLVAHLFFRSLSVIRVPRDVEALRLALDGKHPTSDDDIYETFDHEAARRRSAERGWIEGPEEIAAAFDGRIIRSL